MTDARKATLYTTNKFILIEEWKKGYKLHTYSTLHSKQTGHNSSHNT